MDIRRSPRQRFLLANFVVISNVLGGAGLGVLVDARFFFLGGAMVVFGALYLVRTKCQNCGAFMFRRKMQLLGATWRVWGGWPLPTRCPRCRRPLSANGGEHSPAE
jgi:hypothetical protein